MKLKPYPKYKPSGIEWLGGVPDSWKILRLKRIAEFRYGDSLPSEGRVDGDVPVFGSNGIVGTHSVANTRSPAIIIGRKGSFGKVAFAENAAFSIDTTYFVDGDCTSANLRWLYYCLQTLGLDSFSQDTGVPGLSRDDAYSKVISYPPLLDQSIIATFLDRETAKIDALISKQEKLIELLQEKRQAVISHAVTKGLDPEVPMKPSGVEWLGDVPEHWDRVMLGRLCKQVSDGPHFSPSYVDDGVMFISARNIKVNGWALDDAKFISQEDYVEFSRRVIPEIGDILYTKGGTTGIARVVDLQQPFQVWVHVAVLKIDRELADPYYVAYALNSVGCFEQSQLFTRGATNQDLGLTRMTQIWTTRPPLTEQRAIVEQLDEETSKIDTLIAKAQQAIELQKEPPVSD